MAGAFEAFWERDYERVAFVDDGAEDGEDFEVRVDLADAEGAALGVGLDGDLAEAVEEGGVEQDGGTHVLRELVVLEVALERGVADAHLGGVAVPGDFGALRLEEGDQFVEVGDVGDVAQGDGLVGEQCGAENRQDGVLVARRCDGAGEGFAAVDDEIGHVRESR